MTIPTWQIILFLLIDFVILASIVAAVFFLILFFKSRKTKKIKFVDLNDLEAFKNKNLQSETNVTIENNRPVAPSTLGNSIYENQSFGGLTEFSDIPVRQSVNEGNRLFACQMQDNMQQMNDVSLIESQQASTNFVNM